MMTTLDSPQVNKLLKWQSVQSLSYQDWLYIKNVNLNNDPNGKLASPSVDRTIENSDPEIQVKLIQLDSPDCLNWAVLKDQIYLVINELLINCDISDIYENDIELVNDIQVRSWNLDYKLIISEKFLGELRKIVDETTSFSDFDIRNTSLGGYLDGAIEVVSVLFDLIRVLDKRHWDPRETLIGLVSTVLVYWDMSYRDTWSSLLKYQKDYLFNRFSDLENVEPADPKSCDVHKPGFLVVGPLNNRLHCLLAKRNVSGLIARNTILNGLKKGLPHLSEQKMIDDCWKHYKSLNKTPPKPSVGLCLELISIVEEIFPKKLSLESFEKTIHDFSTLSTNACTEVNRQGGGALGACLGQECFIETSVKGDRNESIYHKKNVNRLLISNYWNLVSSNELVTVGYHPKRGLRYIYRPSFEVDVAIVESIRNYYDKLLRESVSIRSFTEFEQVVRVVLIQEPLKNRPITKASFLSNAVLFPLQRMMWGSLQKFSCFQLTGRWVNSQDLQAINLDLPFWKSADFSAATDNLSSLLTSIVIESITDDDVLKVFLYRNLLGCTVTYEEMCNKIFSYLPLKEREKKRALFPPDFKMSNGQLMGSITSFPILCMVNAAVFRYAYRIYLEEQGIDTAVLKLSNLPCLINGDDLVFKSDHRLLEIWRSLIGEAGLVESPGKSYESKSFAMINSVFFQETSRGLEHVPYYNMSWVTGVKKGDFEKTSINSDGDQEEFKNCLSLGKEVDYYLKSIFLEQGRTSPIKQESLERFYRAIYYNRIDTLEKMGLAYGLKAPYGLGLPFPSTRDQVANSLYLLTKQCSIRSVPSYGDSNVPLTMVPYKYLTCNESRYLESLGELEQRAHKFWRKKNLKSLVVSGAIEKREEKFHYGKLHKSNRSFSFTISRSQLESQVKLLLNTQ